MVHDSYFAKEGMMVHDSAFANKAKGRSEGERKV
jgi:hypothetical protein